MDTVRVIHDREGQSEVSSTDNEHGIIVMKDQAGAIERGSTRRPCGRMRGTAMSNHSSLTVALPEALDAFVRQRVASGRFTSASAVVQEALTLLERREHDRDAALDEIRREIQLGIEQAEAGQLRDGETVCAEIREKLRLSESI